MGYSVWTDAYRYAEWRDWKSGQTVARELYDHQGDPNETRNLAEDQKHADQVKLAAEELAKVQARSR